MVLFTEKYAPTLLDADSVLARLDHVPHVLVHGPEGCGKYTQARLWLERLYGPGAGQLRRKSWEFQTSSRTIELPVYSSNYHYVLSPTAFGIYDRQILQQFIGQVACTANVAQFAGGKPAYKVIVVQAADALTDAAQNALRHTMEAHADTVRLVLLARSLARVSVAVQSRCVLVPLSPTPEQLYALGRRVCRNERIPGDGLTELACGQTGCRGNYRELLNALELRRVGIRKERDADVATERAAAVRGAADLAGAREELYALLSVGQKPGAILRQLAVARMGREGDEAGKRAVLARACAADEGMAIGAARPVMHLERFLLDTART